MDDATTAAADSLQELAAELRAFARARNWEHYHTPNNLTMALAGEAGELLACFQWLTPAESARIMHDADRAGEVESELADVLQYLIRLADVLGIDLEAAVRKKIKVNEQRFRPPKADGVADACPLPEVARGKRDARGKGRVNLAHMVRIGGMQAGWELREPDFSSRR